MFNPETGKRGITFRGSDGIPGLWVSIPCGRCMECRLEKKRQWAMRCVHEASLHDENCFITITYDDAHLPPYGSLDYKEPDDLQLFMKRLRSKYSGRRIRFFACGEYGEYGRPHYHLLLFGFDFPDKKMWSVRSGYKVFRSESLEKLWKYGQSEIGEVNFESAAYVAKYVQKDKDWSADPLFQHMLNERLWRPEFGRMSRRPGIGKEWYERYKDEIWLNDSVIIRGLEVKPPRYYFDQLEREDRNAAFRQRIRRKKEAKSLYDQIPFLPARKAIAESREKLFARSTI